MQIHSLCATFGKLQNSTLSLQDGLNIIYAPNEAGKSTWSRFLSCMFYGVTTRDRSTLADKKRYAPWNGSPMQGRMDFSADGTDYTVFRATQRPTSPMGDFQCIYAGTGNEVKNVDAAAFGENFLGIPREVFERSAFIGQNALAVEQSDELERRIAALITTGEEDVSYSQTRERLKKQLNHRKYNKSGLIPGLENENNILQQKIRTLADITAESDVLRQQMAENQSLVQDLQAQQALWQQVDAQNRYRQSLRQRQSAEEKLRELHDKATAAKAVMEAHPLHGVSEEEWQQRLTPPPLKKPLSPRLTLAGILLALTAAGCLYWLRQSLWTLAAAGGIGLVFGVLSFLLMEKGRTYRSALARQAEQIAAAQQQKNEYILLRQNADNAIAAVKQYRDLYDTLPQVSPVSLEELPVPPLDPQQVAQQLTREKERAFYLRSRWDTLTGQLQAFGDGAALQAQWQDNKEKLDLLQEEYDAISMAMEALDNANVTVQNRFSPALGQRAAEIFSRLTEGRYEKVSLNRDFSLQAQTISDPMMRSLSFLSQGAADQLYLAVRLAICDMVLPKERAIPLILDDALLSFDDKRMQIALDYLLEESQNRQILLFTCQKREAAYLQGRQGVSLITLPTQ